VKSSLITSLGYRRLAAISPRTSLGNVQANVNELISLCEKAENDGAEVIVLPELCITGYTIGDLVRLPDLLTAARVGLEQIRQWTTGRLPVVVVGLPLEIGTKLYNCAAVVSDAHVVGVVPKTYLPSSREYYDNRWYVSGADATVDTIRLGHIDVPFGTDLLFADEDDATCVFGVELCEDVWAVEPPSGKMARSGATLILNLSASNELVGKAQYRRDLIAQQSARTYCAYAYASAGPTESTTDAIYSGHCMIAESGEMIAESDRLVLDGTMVLADVDLRRCIQERLNSTSFNQGTPESDHRIIELSMGRSVKHEVKRTIDPTPFVPATEQHRSERCMEILRLQATALAVRMQHTRAAKAVIGLSGGLDSTLAFLVCCETIKLLSKTNPLYTLHSTLFTLSLPGFGTTDRTRSNASQLAQAFDVEFREIDITASVRQHFKDIGHDESDTSVVFENAQARERTQILMDLANAHQGIVIGTGDLSELALGWSTYNADHMSMYNVNAGVPKTLVRHLIQWYAEHKATPEVAKILVDILNTPISPELLPPSPLGEISQKTEDLIGPYEVHDFFLFRLIRLQEPVRNVAILAVLVFGHKYSTGQLLEWQKVFIERFFANQFKRSSIPDGVKIGSVALSPRSDWRMPSDAKPDTWLTQLAVIRSEIVN